MGSELGIGKMGTAEGCKRRSSQFVVMMEIREASDLGEKASMGSGKRGSHVK